LAPDPLHLFLFVTRAILNLLWILTPNPHGTLMVREVTERMNTLFFEVYLV
jgi:hypothetical protein